MRRGRGVGHVLAGCFRSRAVSAVCLLLVLAAALLPGEGPGVALCHFKLLTRLPCLSCGLTRSFIGMAHLDVSRAVFYHPVGAAVFPLVLLAGALLFVPSSLRERAAGWAENHSTLLNWSAVLLAVAFLLNGLGRIIWLVATARPSPW